MLFTGSDFCLRKTMLQDILTLIIVLVCALLLGRRMVRSIRPQG